ncbi:MAG: hypothetical protein JXR36_00410 [Bacteroidales bacterium]|nr:hypothetical protein [Bacteroidales bacterium]
MKIINRNGKTKRNVRETQKFSLTKYCFALVFCFFCVGELRSQYLENDPSTVERIFWGGNVGLMFGTYTYVSIDPVVGYRLTNRLSAGIGGTYTWINSDYYNYSGQSYGVNFFGSYTLIKNLGEILPIYESGGLLLYGELSYLNISDYYAILPSGRQIWAYTPLAGIAYQTQIGKNSYFVMMFLYNFNESYYSPYSNPVIKASFQF